MVGVLQPVAALVRQAWQVRFYALALVVQKGLPVLALPLIVSIFGRTIFGEYVLLYSAVQIWATLSALGTPLAVVPLWYRQERPLALAGDAHLLIIGLTVTLAVALGAFGLLTTDIGSRLAGEVGIGPWRGAGIVLAFGYIYNLNQFALAVARAREWQGRYLVAAALGGLVLIAGLLIAGRADAPGLEILVLVQAGAMLGGTLLLLDAGMLTPLQKGIRTLRRHARVILVQSVPLTAYTLVTLVAMSIDKWAARAWFPLETFNAYAIDYQAAFTMMFVPAAVNLYNGPVLARLTTAGDEEGVCREMARARLASTSGALCVAISMAAYAWLTGLGITPGYWLLVLGFVFEANFIVLSNRMMAMLRPGQLLGIALGCVTLYAALLYAIGRNGNAALLYIAMPAYSATMLAVATWRTRQLAKAAVT